MVTIVPEGLVLLTALTYAIATGRMARRGALSQQLNAVESLASADVMCLDKTGTLTEDRLRVVGLVPAEGVDEEELSAVLGRYAASAPAGGSTLEAIAEAHPAAAEPVTDVVPFSSRRRWSGVRLGHRTIVLGAPEHFDLGEGWRPARGPRPRAGGGCWRWPRAGGADALLPRRPAPGACGRWAWWCWPRSCAPTPARPSPTCGSRAWSCG